jgi:hypothetical protein
MEPAPGRIWQFEELALRIERDGASRYAVRVTQSPYGSKARHTAFAFSKQEGLELIHTVEASLLAGYRQGAIAARDLGRTGSASPRGLSPQAVGDRLFRSLFSGSVQETLLLSLGRVENQPNTGLRIRLQLDPSLPDMAEISALPWELIYRADTRDHLARNPLTPLVRYLEVPRLTAAAPLPSSLRMLIVRARPRGSGLLDLEAESDRLASSWQLQKAAEIEVLDPATLSGLRLKLMSDVYHVLHFMGHGDFAAATGEGSLVFEDARGDPALVSGRLLADTLKDCRSLRLVFLNACDTASSPRRQGQDPFSGVASALVMAGIPSVLAMQFPISDQAALVFSQHFYEALASGLPVDAAAAEGRLAVHLSSPTSWEWATPALFMSVLDGRILAPVEATRLDPASRGSLPEKPARPIQADTVGAAGGVTVGGVGQRITGGIRISRAGTTDEPRE